MKNLDRTERMPQKVRIKINLGGGPGCHQEKTHGSVNRNIFKNKDKKENKIIGYMKSIE
jgi:hypothetical protein